MAAEVRFRVILPIAQCVSAILFGGFGLWERYYVLDQPFFSGTWWDSTARFHVWPWPYKFAAVTNFPAVLVGSLVSWPLAERWPNLPESAQCALCLPFVVLLWFRIGGWFDRRWGWMEGPPSPRLPWVLLLLFTLFCAGGASLYVGSSTDYLLSGVVIWTIVGLALAAPTIYRTPRDGSTHWSCRKLAAVPSAVRHRFY